MPRMAALITKWSL